MVRKRGFEPPRGCPRQPLKLVRLPFRHFRVEVKNLSSIDRTDSVSEMAILQRPGWVSSLALTRVTWLAGTFTAVVHR
jgi:hypothetical protein